MTIAINDLEKASNLAKRLALVRHEISLARAADQCQLELSGIGATKSPRLEIAALEGMGDYPTMFEAVRDSVVNVLTAAEISLERELGKLGVEV